MMKEVGYREKLRNFVITDLFDFIVIIQDYKELRWGANIFCGALRLGRTPERPCAWLFLLPRK